jgi:tRNA pseudouridine38-40 synthase
MRYFIYFAYNGTAYHGWQIQPNGISVQEVFTKGLRTLLREDTDVVAAGRTDTGVHARQMIAHFDSVHTELATGDYVRRLNSILPKDIAVDKIVTVKPDAHARFDAISRKYEYHVYIGKNVFRENLAVRMFHPLDFNLMNEAALKLKDFTDFTSFSKLHTDVKTNNCVIKQATWQQNGDEWVFCIEADRFLRNMVRSIVGTLFDVGMHKISIADFCRIIEIKDRCKAGVSVPAHGLYLVEVNYPEEIFHVNNEQSTVK